LPFAPKVLEGVQGELLARSSPCFSLILQEGGEETFLKESFPPRAPPSKNFGKEKEVLRRCNSASPQKAIAAVEKINCGGYFIDQLLQRRPSLLPFAPKVLEGGTGETSCKKFPPYSFGVYVRGRNFCGQKFSPAPPFKSFQKDIGQRIG
jgi:hypothetical protein